MPAILSALDILTDGKKFSPSPVTILFGDDAFLSSETFRTIRDRILSGEDAEFSLTAFEGGSVDFATVHRELTTRAMFGGENRLVRVSDADAFLSAFSPELEDYLDASAPNAFLVLQTLICASNTRIYKKTADKGTLIDCRAPSAGAIAAWLPARAKKFHGLTLGADAASALVECVGTEPGLLDQELARLALTLPSGERIDAQTVLENVGAWRLRKTWDMLDAFLLGDVPSGLRQLDMLLAAGENPVGVLAQIATTLRRFASVSRQYLDGERTGRKVPLPTLLQQAQVPPFAVKKSVDQMIRISRFRGEKILSRLLETDLAMKGASRTDPRALLERFLIELGHKELRDG